MSSPPAEPGRLPDWIGTWGSVIAPASLLSAVLFYFGYVSSRSQYEYFGVDVDAIGLSTQDFVMRSPQALLAPLIVLPLLATGLLIGHARLRERSAAGTAARTIRLLRTAGIVLLTVAIALVVAFPVAGDGSWYPLTTPLALAAGGGLLAYVAFLRRSAGNTPPPSIAGRAALVLVCIMVAAGVLWATATVAQWSGRGRAKEQAVHLTDLPHVVLDTKERLYLRNPIVEETALPAVKDQAFKYRYRKLRLLIVGRDRMFLVPETWNAGNATLVVPLNDARVQFQFQNDPP